MHLKQHKGLKTLCEFETIKRTEKVQKFQKGLQVKKAILNKVHDLEE